MTPDTTARTTDAGTCATPMARVTPGPWQLAGEHTRYLLLQTVREPIAVIGALAFPALSMLFFVVPMREVATNAAYATQATVALCFFAVMANCLFTFGVGVADDRARPWDSYLRSLPVSTGPRIAARLANGLCWSLLSMVPVLVIAATLTQATVTPGRFLAGLGTLALGAAPFLFGGLAIGYLCSAKVALAIAQVAMFGLAFGGGLFVPPSMFPGWLERLSLFLPSRGGRDLAMWASMGDRMPSSTVWCVALWSVGTLVAAVWAYRRDEGRRFR